MKRINGKGLRWVNQREKWYGGGYCGVCGSHEIIPTACRFWDPDDGWKFGTLCEYCADECEDRGPQPDDYAYQEASETAGRLDIEAAYGDSDSAYASSRDRDGWK